MPDLETQPDITSETEVREDEDSVEVAEEIQDDTWESGKWEDKGDLDPHDWSFEEDASDDKVKPTEESTDDTPETHNDDVEEGDEPNTADLPGEEEEIAADVEPESEDNSEAGIAFSLLMKAGRLGVSEEDVQFYGQHGDETLERYLNDVETRGGVQQQDGEETPRGDSEPHDFNLAAFEVNFGEDNDFDEVIVGQVEGMAKHQHEQNQKLMGILEEVGGGLLALLDEGLEVEMNDMIDDLAEDKAGDFKLILGAGNQEVALTQKQSDNRQALMNEIKAIQQARREKGLPALSVRKVTPKALKEAFGKDVSKNSKTTTRLTKRSRNGFTKKTTRVTKTSKAPTTRQRVYAKIDEIAPGVFGE